MGREQEGDPGAVDRTLTAGEAVENVQSHEGVAAATG